MSENFINIPSQPIAPGLEKPTIVVDVDAPKHIHSLLTAVDESIHSHPQRFQQQIEHIIKGERLEDFVLLRTALSHENLRHYSFDRETEDAIKDDPGVTALKAQRSVATTRDEMKRIRRQEKVLGMGVYIGRVATYQGSIQASQLVEETTPQQSTRRIA